MNRRTIALTAAAAALAFPAGAAAHVSVAPIGDVPPEGFGKVDVRVPHGCDGSPTTGITVRLPDTVIGATPQVVPGWRITMKEGKLATPVESHGETITEGVREVTWSGGRLPDHHLQEFGMSIQTAGGKPGETAYFKVLQQCAKGEIAWAEIPEGDEEPEAPAAELVFAGAERATAAPSEAESTAGVSADEVDGKASRGLAIAALVVGALGLAVGAAGFATARRRA